MKPTTEIRVLQLLAAGVLAIAFVVCVVVNCGCDPIDEPPGEYRVCCADGGVVDGCPEDACDLDAEADQ